MTNAIQIFENRDFGSIRTVVDENGTALFCGKDIATALGYDQPRKAIERHCKGGTKRTLLTNGGKQEANFIPEGDVYRLICNSKLPSAKKFERWVYDDVLPTLRRDGSYNMPFSVPTTFSEALHLAAKLEDERLALEMKIEADADKVELAEKLEATEGTISVGDLATILKKNGVNTGRTRLMELMHTSEEGYLMSSMDNNNVPTQKALNLGVLTSKEVPLRFNDGTGKIAITPLVTPKGIKYFTKRYCTKEKF